jgi:hypothetical protein
MKKFIACYQPKNHKNPIKYIPIWGSDLVDAMKKAESTYEKGYMFAWMLTSKIFRDTFYK